MQIKKYDGDLSESIKMITTTMSGVREQAKVTENEIHSTINHLIFAVTGMLRDREAVLISDVEAIKHQKEKELQLQKDELEFLLSGIRHAVLFSEALMNEGKDTEIVAGYRQVVSHMATLTNEREKGQLEPATDTEIKFIDGEGNQLYSAIREFGAVVVATGISAEQSIIETPTGNKSQINQAYSFKVIFVDKKGTKVSKDLMSRSVKGLAVAVTGPSPVLVHHTIFNCQSRSFFNIFFCLLLHFRPPLKQKKRAERVVR